MLKASDILYTSWEEIPLHKVRLILQILPVIRWEVHHHWGNTYLKNFLLKQLFKSRKIYLKTTAEQRVDLFTHEIGWIQDFSTTFPIPSYKLKGKTFLAPAQMLADISVERLMEADIALFRYIHSEKKSYLGHFLAMLYILPGVDLSDEVLSENAELLLQIDEKEKIAIIRSYLGSFEALRKECQTLFPSEDNPSSRGRDDRGDLKRESRKPKDPAPNWKKLLFELANTPGYPGMESAKSAPAWEALPYMNHEQEKILKQNQRLKSS